jgi:biotin synthase
MAGIGPFIYHPDTPIEKTEGNCFELALKVMAILRLLMPDINIPATTAMETLNPNGRLIALQCGANVVMPNATETAYRKHYEIYPGKICIGDSPKHCRFCIENKIKSINRNVAENKGYHKSNS